MVLEGLPGWEQLPNWLTLAAAIAAGIFAQRAAHWTKEQAEASDEQVTIAREELTQAADQFDRQLTMARAELAITSGEAERQRKETEKANRRLEESRLDALAPAIYAVASLREARNETDIRSMWAKIEFRDQPEPDGVWLPVPIDQMPFDSDRQHVLFRMTVDMTIKNVSDKVAVVALEKYHAHGEVDRTGFAIAPGEAKDLMWKRTVTLDSLRNGDEPDPMFDLDFYVWDISNTVQDTYRFWAGLMFSEVDGSRVKVNRTPMDAQWQEEIVAVRMKRTYPPAATPPPAPEVKKSGS